jgi:hypothetical protein
MKNKMRRSLVAPLVVSFLAFVGLGLVACGAPAERAGEESSASTAQSELANVTPATVICSSDCSAAGGVPISETCTTCAATNSSVTCDGVTTECAARVTTCTKPRQPVTRCSAQWAWCGCPEVGSPDPRGWVCGACK